MKQTIEVNKQDYQTLVKRYERIKNKHEMWKSVIKDLVKKINDLKKNISNRERKAAKQMYEIIRPWGSAAWAHRKLDLETAMRMWEEGGD
ncbi:hypothetical protein UFOVP1365_31 [uncultured Caudovirales phage]|uniref:ParB protein family C-terminal domain-containing protein n=1 Tax=uncultured Caudovirales phage TaxID=2100421 RepID=A0A6J5RX56_9CAUD|nr:hypothetical protein UFOVP1365_31 [uncultured Caudovirales phage]